MILSICSHKGGTGKTTTAVSLSGALVKQGKSVLLVDLDPQSNLSYSLELTHSGSDISEVFLGQKSISDVIVEKDGIHVVPATMKLADIELSLQSAEDRVQFLTEILSPIATKYDWIILDCPPSRSLLTVNALVLADYVITPIFLDVLSIQGLLYIIKTIYDIKRVFNDKIEFLGILAVNVDLRKRLSKEVLAFIQDQIEYPLFDTMIRTNIKLTEAPSHGLTIQSYAPGSTGANDYNELAKELTKKVKEYGIR